MTQKAQIFMILLLVVLAVTGEFSRDTLPYHLIIFQCYQLLITPIHIPILMNTIITTMEVMEADIRTMDTIMAIRDGEMDGAEGSDKVIITDYH